MELLQKYCKFVLAAFNCPKICFVFTNVLVSKPGSLADMTTGNGRTREALDKTANISFHSPLR